MPTSNMSKITLSEKQLEGIIKKAVTAAVSEATKKIVKKITSVQKVKDRQVAVKYQKKISAAQRQLIEMRNRFKKRPTGWKRHQVDYRIRRLDEIIKIQKKHDALGTILSEGVTYNEKGKAIDLTKWELQMLRDIKRRAIYTDEDRDIIMKLDSMENTVKKAIAYNKIQKRAKKRAMAGIRDTITNTKGGWKKFVKLTTKTRTSMILYDPNAEWGSEQLNLWYHTWGQHVRPTNEAFNSKLYQQYGPKPGVKFRVTVPPWEPSQYDIDTWNTNKAFREAFW